MNKFYVYVHRRMSDSKVFYVGKGARNRDTMSYGRSAWWNRIVEKHGVYSERVLDRAPEPCCFALERILIAAIGRGNLCNLSDGGEGSGGHKMSEANRIAHAARMTGSKNWNWGKAKPPEVRQKISAAKIGVKDSEETRAKKRLARLGNKNPSFDPSIRKFVHDSGECFVGTSYDFRIAHGLKQQSISRIVLGLRTRHKGWRHV